MSFLKYISIAILLVFLVACNTRKSSNIGSSRGAVDPGELKGTLTLSGAHALTPLAEEWASGFMKAYPGVEIIINDNGSLQGLNDLQSQKSQLAMISRALTDEESAGGIWAVPVAREGVAPVANASNPYIQGLMEMGLSIDEFRKVFIDSEEPAWGSLLGTSAKEKVKRYARISGSGASDAWAGFLYSEPSKIQGAMMESDEDLIRAVAADKYAIGFCNFSYAYKVPDGELRDGIKVIPFDLDFDDNINSTEYPFETLEKAHRALWLGLYPKVLCRNLFLASDGKPADPLVKEFIKYVLTTGQEKVLEAGLCELNNVHIRNALEELDLLPGTK